jgi:hypothetical protein
MRTWRALLGESNELYARFGLRLIDDFTGGAPLGRVAARLEVSDGAGAWRATQLEPARTLSGVLNWPKLERVADPVGRPPRRYRVQLTADFYLPWYRMNADGIEFDAYPWNDRHPPTDYTGALPVVVAPELREVKLTPSVNYPFPTHVRVLRGVVKDAAGVRVADAEVTRGAVERTLTDRQGNFALPLRWVPDGPVQIDANDHRLARLGTLNITLPQALSSSQTIIIN